jgi:Rha family phage regulatory protein
MSTQLDLLNTNTEQTISSREIAELTGKRHDHVIRDIKNLNQFYIENSRPQIRGRVYKDANNQDRPEYLLTKRQSLDLVMGYSLALRIAVTDRWEYLEKAKKPESKLDWMRQAVKNEEEKLLLEAEIKFNAPKVEYFDDLVDRGLNMNLRNTAKGLGQRQRKFNDWLIEKGYLYRDAGKKLCPTARSCDKGLMVMKEFAAKTNSVKAGNQTLVTPKGRETFNLLLKGLKL